MSWNYYFFYLTRSNYKNMEYLHLCVKTNFICYNFYIIIENLSTCNYRRGVDKDAKEWDVYRVSSN